MTYGYKDICEKHFRKISEHTVMRFHARLFYKYNNKHDKIKFAEL